MSYPLVGLLDEARRLAHAGARSNEENEVLKTALQNFIQRPLSGKTEEHTELFSKMSTRISEVGLSQKVFKYLHNRGVVFVGEAYMLRIEGKSGKGYPMRPDVFGELEEKLRLPQSTRSLTAGWRPPYWEEPTFIKALNGAPETYGEVPIWKDGKRYHWFKGTTMGEFLIRCRQSRNRPHSPSYCDGRNRYNPAMETLQKQIATGNLHAAAIIPPDWEPPKAP
ncbi:MAG: hypothetical protein WC813_01330 [Patescibacteria group bacterium]|jgi:hypothetical protein